MNNRKAHRESVIRSSLNSRMGSAIASVMDNVESGMSDGEMREEDELFRKHAFQRFNSANGTLPDSSVKAVMEGRAGNETSKWAKYANAVAKHEAEAWGYIIERWGRR